MTKIKAHAAILAANLIYGVNFIAIKQVLPDYLSWQALALFRGFGALLLLTLVGFFLKREKIEKTDWWKLIIGGVLGVTLNQSLLVWGVELTSPINAAIIMTSNPLFVMIFSALILGFPITWFKSIGVLVGASGALILVLTSHHGSFKIANSLGDLIIVSNSVLYALYLVWTKPLMAKYGSFTVMNYTFLFGSIPVLLYGLPAAMEVNYAAIPEQAYWAMAFIIVCATFLTYMFNIIGLKHVNPTTVSIYVYLQPIVATIIAIVLETDSFSWYKIVSMLLVFIGVYLVNLSNKSNPKIVK